MNHHLFHFFSPGADDDLQVHSSGEMPGWKARNPCAGEGRGRSGWSRWFVKLTPGDELATKKDRKSIKLAMNSGISYLGAWFSTLNQFCSLSLF